MGRDLEQAKRGELRLDVLRGPPSERGIPLLTRLQNHSYAKTCKSFTEVEAAINKHLATLADQVRLKGQLLEAEAHWTGRLSRLDLIEQQAALQVDAEFSGFVLDAQIHAKRQDLELARLELELKRARKESDDLDRMPSPEGTRQQTLKDRLEVVFARVRETETALDAHIDEIVRGAGGEDHLNEAARRHVDHVRALKADLIPRLYEELA